MSQSGCHQPRALSQCLWNVAIQIQSLESMDAQARRSVISHEMRAVKINTVHVPVVSAIIKELTGQRYPQFPKWLRYHKAKTVNLETDHTEDITRYRGADLYRLYNTLQTYSASCCACRRGSVGSSPLLKRTAKSPDG